MVLTITMVMAKKTKMGSDSVPGALEGPILHHFRAERAYGNENLPAAPEGTLCVAARAGCGSGLDNISN
eukprot:6563548-Alexandrium_andersonii.AAC.1